jgi:hypothetical protein
MTHYMMLRRRAPRCPPTRSKARTAVLAREGDAEGAGIWRQITAAVEELQRTRRPDEAVN